jgi:hypothetical protein
MAADIAAIVRNLTAFYVFDGKAVLHVGAGGGQFIAYAVRARRVVAVDSDPDAVDRLKAAVREAGLEERFHVLCTDFLAVTAPADVVFFEFCLHEMADPAGALAHARTLARETVIADHAPDSPWSWCCAEEAKVVRSWGAADALRPDLSARFQGTQVFRDYAELDAKIGMLGEPTLGRIAPYRGQTVFTIPMPYRFALLR